MTHNSWKTENAFSRGMAVLLGEVLHRQDRKAQRFILIDADNQRAIEEICKILGIVADIVRTEVFKVPYFSELIQNGKSQIECEHDIEKKILEFAKQKTTTFFNLDCVEARFSNKTTEWFEIEITFYDIEHKVLSNILYPKKEFDESALASWNKGEEYI
jgi:ABC-type uncharacterized transport system substrate-binding protein